MTRGSARIKAQYAEKYGPILKTRLGKPYFELRPDLGISIAHDGDLTVGAVAPGNVGIDIVRLPLAVEFSPEELCWLFEEPPQRADLPAFWAAREAYIKCTGHDPNVALAVAGRYTTTPLLGSPIKLGEPLITGTCESYIFTLPGYIGALCLERPDPATLAQVLKALT